MVSHDDSQILSNSLKYSQGQDIIIRSYTNDGHVTLEIKDFGRGISHKRFTTYI